MYEKLGDDRGAARTLIIYADVLRADGRLEDAIIIMKEALDVLEDEQPDESTTLLAERVARALLFTGRVEEARDTVER